MGKTSHKAKPHRVIFRSPLQELLIKIKRLQVQGILPQTWSIPKYLPIVESLCQFPIDLDFVETSSIYTNPST